MQLTYRKTSQQNQKSKPFVHLLELPDKENDNYIHFNLFKLTKSCYVCIFTTKCFLLNFIDADNSAVISANKKT